MRLGIDVGLTEVNKLADEAVRVGREVGRLETSIESSRWIETLLSMIRGENGLDDSQVRVIGLNILRSMSSWLSENHNDDLYWLKNHISNTIGELEKWKTSTT